MKNVYSHSLKILSSQRDSLFRLRLDDALKLFQDIATFHAHELGIDGPQLMEKDKAFWIVTRTIIHCHAIPIENEDITAKTWPLPTNGLRCERCYTLSQNDEIKIAGVSEWVVIDAEHDTRDASNRLTSPPTSTIRPNEPLPQVSRR